MKRGIKMAMMVPLLPSELIPAGQNYMFDWLQETTTQKQATMVARFQRYWTRQWANNNISVSGCRDRTNNSEESFHATLKRLIGLDLERAVNDVAIISSTRQCYKVRKIN